MRLLLFLLTTVPTAATAATLQVGPTRTYTTITDAVDASALGDTIEVDAGTYAEEVELINTELTLTAVDGANQTIINAVDTALVIEDSIVAVSGFTLWSQDERGFEIDNSQVGLTDMIVEDTDAGDDGSGGIIDDSLVSIRQSVFSRNNSGDMDGGHLYIDQSDVTISDCTFDEGTAEDGGAMDIETSDVMISNTTFSNNSIESSGAWAPGRGGAVSSRNSSLTIEASIFVDNTAIGETYGGALCAFDSALELITVEFDGNTSDQLGGALALVRGDAIMDDILITSSVADWRGGGIYAEDTDITLGDSSLIGNESHASGNDSNPTFSGSGAAMWLEGTTYEIYTTRFESNTAESTGAGIYTDTNGSISNSDFISNTAGWGAALYSISTNTTITDTIFDGNDATNQGGAIRINDSNGFIATNCIFTNNTAGGNGGAIAGATGNYEFTSSGFDGNSATSGGAIFLDGGDLTIDDSDFNTNISSDRGGAIRFQNSTSGDITVTHSTFTDNSSGTWGGGLSIFQGNDSLITDNVFTRNQGVYGGGASLTDVASAEVQRNWFCANNATDHGGGLRISDISAWTNAFTATNNLFIENTATNEGGGFYFGASTAGELINNTFMANSANDGGAVWADTATITTANNIIAHTSNGYGAGSNLASLGITYSLGFTNTPDHVEATAWASWSTGTGNIEGDPLLTNYTNDGDCTNDKLWPQAGSPVIDAGDPSIDDPDGSTSDIGAFGGPGSDELYADDDGDGYDITTDCDDTDASINPGATDICDGIDNDCDGDIDDGLSTDADGDGYTAIGSCGGSADDCNDFQIIVNPGNTEVCDGFDNDCDGTVDGPDSTDAITFYADDDSDSYGDDSVTTADCSVPTGYVDVGGDCDDNVGAVNPGATEICDGIDNDCDGTIDGPDATDAITYYADTDGDTYGDPNTSIADCSMPTDYVVDDTDCDDTNDAVNPGMTEVCDGADNNCDTDIDEGLATDTWYDDNDGDTFGDANAATTDCAQPAATVADATDCDDTNITINPNASDTCDDGVDQDCDGSDAVCTGIDADGDGYCDANCTDGSLPGDCDDNDATVSPAAIEVCDSVDNDCDGTIDGASATDAVTYYEDADGDAYGDTATAVVSCTQPTGYVTDNTDCDDTDAALNPSMAEACDGIDNNCSGTADDGLTFEDWYTDADGDTYGDDATVVNTCAKPTDAVSTGGDCDDVDDTINPGATEVCEDTIDQDCDGIDPMCTGDDTDGDGYCDAQACSDGSTPGDCDDADDTVYPGADEICDGQDNDCDGNIDGPDSTDATTSYADLDGDTYGDDSSSITDCAIPTDYVLDNTDCDDDDDALSPGATEVCDGIDNNCDGATDEGLSFSTWYSDADGDTYGDPSTGTSECAQPANTVDNDADCDDASAAINPAMPEICDDAIDQDCDGYDPACDGEDLDGDGYCGALNCTDGSIPGDCDDTNAAINPAATEVCDTIDNNCNGSVDEGLTSDADGDGYSDIGSCEGSADDCDDSLNTTYPGADELCDGVDNDCDTDIDEDAVDTQTFYEDADGDGYGDADVSVIECNPPADYVTDATDCDDALDTTYPGAVELCDGIDNDCDTEIDNNVTYVDWFMDGDGDGYGDPDELLNDCIQPSGYVLDDADCDDTDDMVNPDMDELCNGYDDNCDTVIDDDAIDQVVWYADTDGDSFGDPTVWFAACDGPDGYVDDDEDCDDTREDIYPGAEEVCEDTEDLNCDGLLPNEDLDEDGFLNCDDCDDENAEIYPGAEDLPGDGIDADCDGVDPSGDDPGKITEPIVGYGGCGCQSLSPWSLSWLWVFPALLFIRRRESGLDRLA